jgi:hypothetical protein
MLEGHESDFYAPTTTTIVIDHALQPNSKPGHIEAIIESRNKVEIRTLSRSKKVSVFSATHPNLYVTRILIEDAPLVEDKGQDVLGDTPLVEDKGQDVLGDAPPIEDEG